MPIVDTDSAHLSSLEALTNFKNLKGGFDPPLQTAELSLSLA